MKSISANLRNHLPIRPRVAFVLAVAERVLPALAKNPAAFNAARKALTDGWQWEERGIVNALRLYEDNDEALALQGSLIAETEASAALCTVTSAFYYLLWHAFGQDLSRGRAREGEIPGMTEVTEDVIDEVCNFATRTSLCDTQWIQSLAERLSAGFRTANPEELGSAVPRQYFQ